MQRAARPVLDGSEIATRSTRVSGVRRSAAIVGITYRQLDYWARTDLVRPSIADAQGSGTQRAYSYRDLVRLKVVKSLLDAGVKLQTARKAIEYLREDLGDDWATASLVLDGTNSVLARTDDTLIDLVRRGQGVLNIVPLGTSCEELDADVREHVAELDAAARSTRSRREADHLASRCRTSRSASRTTPSGSSRSSSTSTRSSGNTNRARSCSRRDRDGNPVQAFTPDFYLPGLRPLHRDHHAQPEAGHEEEPQGATPVQELYPEVHVRVLYQRDYLHLLVKYGLEPPSQLVADGLVGAAPRAPRPRAARRAR